MLYREPKNSADRSVLSQLNSVDPGYVYEVRKDPSANIPTKVDFKILDPLTGKFNIAAGTRGVAVATMRVTEKDNDVESTKSISAFEDSWGVHTTVDRSGFKDIQTAPSKYFDVKSVSLQRNNPDQERDSNMKELYKLDLKDDRKARSDRLAKFAEAYGPDLVNIPKILDVKPILLDDDIVLHSFKCRKIVGLPAHDKFEQGSVVVSLVRNVKLNRLRLHFSYAEADAKFTAKEKFQQKVSASAGETAGSSVESSLDVQYKQTSNFRGGECYIPIDTSSTFLSNVLVYRKANKELIMKGYGYKTNALSAVVNSVAGMCGGTFTVFACAERIRLRYYCCSSRCLNSLSCCCPVEAGSNNASYSHAKTIEFNASDSFILGGPTNWSETSFHPTPLQTTSKPTETEQWQSRCCFEHTGDFSWKCCVFVPEKEESIKTKDAPTIWNVTKTETDDIVLEFTYKPITTYFRGVSSNKLTMTLDAQGQDADDVYNQARKMVSVIGVEFGECYESFEKALKDDAKKKEEKEKEELLKKEEAAKTKAAEEKKKLEADAEAAERKAIDKEEQKYHRENARVLVKIATEEAIQKKMKDRMDAEEKAALARVTDALKTDNKKHEYLSYIDYLEKRKNNGGQEPKWPDEIGKTGTLNMSLDLSGVTK